ncbi:MAG: hypothetical protein AABX00_01215 [Nanoarchaeota archaeon]
MEKRTKIIILVISSIFLIVVALVIQKQNLKKTVDVYLSMDTTNQKVIEKLSIDNPFITLETPILFEKGQKEVITIGIKNIYNSVMNYSIKIDSLETGQEDNFKSWFQFSFDSITIEANGSLAKKGMITVPIDAKEGEHKFELSLIDDDDKEIATRKLTINVKASN